MSFNAGDLSRLTDAERIDFVASLTPLEAAALATHWPFWARAEQSIPGGNWVNWLILAGRGFGKALALDTPIATPVGWSTMGALRAGDVVFDERGMQCRVVAAHPVQIGRPCFRVRFSDGAEVVADEDHLWTTLDRRTRKAMRRRTGAASAKPQCQPRHFARTLTTRDIAATLYDGREVNHAIPCAGPLQCIDAALPIDPYLLGLWLGDGSTSGAEITTADPEIVAAFEAAGFRMTARGDGKAGLADTYSIAALEGSRRCATTGRMIATGNAFRTQLGALGVLGHKRIPGGYLRASPAQRLALLQGLFDTDGYCDRKTGGAEFCSTSQELARGMRELALSLGFKAVTYEGRATIDGRDCGPKFRVCFTAHRETPIFRLPRKIAAQPINGAQAERARRRYIVAVEPTPSAPVRCITVDSPSRLYLAGESMIATHNTRTGAETVREWVKSYKYVNLIGATSDDVREIMVEGESGILAICPNDERPRYIANKRRLEWPNGARSILFSAEEPDRLRGKQHMKIWADELAAWRYVDAWDQAAFGLRLGDRPQAVITTTPRPIKLVKDLIADKTTLITRGSTYDNATNLAEAFIHKVIAKYEGTRLGRQELAAEVLDDTPGALWTRAMIDRALIKAVPRGVDMRRIVVSLDPNVVDGEKSDEFGMIVAALGSDGHGYVLADESRIFSIAGAEWASHAIGLYRKWKADRIVAEVNNGGDMIEATIRMIDSSVSFSAVHATRGKVTRAEPVSALYEKGLVHHVGSFAKLEDQMAEFTTDFDKDKAGYSPDRVDALVWAITELKIDPTGNTGMLDFYRAAAEAAKAKAKNAA